MRIERWTFKSPLGEILGAVIVEAEPLTEGNPAEAPEEGGRKNQGPKVTEKQVKAMYAAMHAKGKSGDDATVALLQVFGVEHLEEVGRGAASRWLQVNLPNQGNGQ